MTGEAPLVNTTTSSLGGLVNDQQIADLPLNGRNYIDLTMVQPGVQENTHPVGGGAGASGTWYSSNGAPPRSNNFSIDGALMQNQYGAGPNSIGATTLGVDGIKEYKVVTSMFSAEYGLSMGSQMVIVSKSGTNQWHGDLFEYLRNSSLDAANEYDTPAGSGGSACHSSSATISVARLADRSGKTRRSSTWSTKDSGSAREQRSPTRSCPRRAIIS